MARAFQELRIYGRLFFARAEEKPAPFTENVKGAAPAWCLHFSFPKAVDTVALVYPAFMFR